MVILAFDTSNCLASVSVYKKEEIIDYIIDNKVSSQAENLFFLIETLFSKNNINYNNIEAIATTIGPGSFTGIRVALAALKGINLVLKKPVLGLNNLEIIAFNASKLLKNKLPILTILDARRSQCYIQIFDKNIEKLCEYKIIKLSEIKDYLNVEKFNIVIEKTLEDNSYIKNIIEVSEKAIITENVNAKTLAESFNNFKHRISYHTEPFYIRPPDAKKNNLSP